MGKRDKKETVRVSGFEALRSVFNLEAIEEKSVDTNKYKNYSPDTTKKNTSHSPNKQSTSRPTPTGTPTTPYNFVPLLNFRLPPCIDTKDISEAEYAVRYTSFLKSNGIHTGYFKVTLTNLSPLYIENNGEFHTQGGRPCIPGSSLRGALKNLFKILSASSMRTGVDGDITNRHLYYRSMAGKNSDPTRNLYNNEMRGQKTVTIKGKSKTIETVNVSAGFLMIRDKEYIIIPAEYTRVKYTSSHNAHSSVNWNPNKKECIIHSGKMQNKKHYYCIHSPHWGQEYIIPDDVIQGYIYDKNRKGLSLIDENGQLNSAISHKLDNHNTVVPCFFSVNGKTIKHFGANPYYRIPYKSKIGDRIPSSLRDTSPDWTDMLFGFQKYWSSRIHVEDAYLAPHTPAKYLAKSTTKILMGANPTSFQFYLEPNTQNQPCHYDDTSTRIRGYKMYWHKKADWKAEKIDNDKVQKSLQPLDSYHQFTCKVHFQNLDTRELGSLVSLFQMLAEPHRAIKLGMGKPLGMGSIRVDSQLYLRDSQYYQKLFDDNGFYEYSLCLEPEVYQEAFTKYLKEVLTPTQYMDYTKCLETLHIMLDSTILEDDNPEQDAKWAKATAYMNINNKEQRGVVTSRTVLPSAKAVKDSLHKK